MRARRLAAGDERAYRTGDLARVRGDGAIDYLGRLDFQVKLRGFRIELGEIEVALEALDGVRQAVVRVGDDRLVAYWVGAARPWAELAAALERTLPAHMVPSAGVHIEALPLTPSGKVDRRALPDPDIDQADYAAPREGTETALASIWSELLGVERVGRRDDFFALGGHSLLATRLVSRLRADLGVEIPLREVFDAPRLSTLAERVDRGSAATLPGLTLVDRSLPIAASFAQERLWVLDRLMPESAAYHLPAAIELEGSLSESPLREAFEALVERHESLRTRFVEGDDAVPVQVVEPTVTLPLAAHDATGWTEAQLAAAILEHAALPFDLAQAPLFRVALFRRGHERHVLSLVMHHIVSDGWSMAVLVRELGELYAARAEGRPSAPTPLPVQYPDYAVWQRSWLTGEELERQSAYWREQLAGAPPALELPLDRPRPKVKGDAGGSVPIALERAPLDGLAGKLSATPFMVLLAAWSLLLGRHARTEDVVVGTPVAGRRAAELEHLVGVFINTLALRTDLSGDPSFTELVSRVRRATLDAYEHQDLPFEKLVGDLSVPRDTSITPLFQVMLILQNTEASTLRAGSAISMRLRDDLTLARERFDVTLTLTPEATVYRGALSYDAALFDRATVERLVHRLRLLIERAVAAPNTPARALVRPDDDEHARQLEIGGATRSAPNSDETMAERLETWAERSPNRPAIRRTDGSWVTYGELLHRARARAAALLERGLGPEQPVGLAVERSPELPISVLACWLAGVPYVPLDPTHPPARNAQIVADAAVEAIVVDRESPTLAPLGVAQWPLEALSGRWREPPAVPEEALAYAIFTSGSTGRPKGVEVARASVEAVIRAMAERPGMSADDVLVAVTTLGFDVSVPEMFLPFWVGGRVAIATDDEVHDPGALAALIDAADATVMQGMPGLWAGLADGGFRRPQLTAVAGGESLPLALARKLEDRVGALWNIYGPTEATVWSTVGLVARGVTEITIGQPLPGDRTYVGDDDARLVPLGAVGALFLGGVGVARGYRGRPGLTAERFSPDPYGAPGSRMYATGDLARWRGDALVHLGRSDTQVKVRGFRVELGEVNAALRAVPEVRDAAVAVQGTGVDARLVAWVVGAATLERVRDVLAERLPPYMIPTSFVPLETLPRLPNGKLDRRSLPEPRLGEAPEARRAADPREARVADLFVEVLGADPAAIDVEASFFDALGGTSLTAVRLARRLAEELGQPVPVVMVFAHPTVRELTAALAAPRAAAEDAPEDARLEERSDRRRRAIRRRRGGKRGSDD